MSGADELTKSLAAVETRVTRFAYCLNTTGVFHALRTDETLLNAKHSAIAAATGVLADFANGRVHKSLNLVEKLGFDPFGRVAERKRYAAAFVGAARFSMEVGSTLLANYMEQKSKGETLADLASWMGFVHGAEQTSRMSVHLDRRARELRLMSATNAGAAFGKGVGAKLTGLRRPADARLRYEMLLDVASAVDTQDAAVRARLMDLASYAGIPDAEVDVAVADFEETNQAESYVIGLSGTAIAIELEDLFSAADGARLAALATFDNDPFAASRARHRQLVTQTGASALLGALTLVTGGAGDFLLAAAAPIVHAAIGSGGDDARTMLRVSKSLNGLPTKARSKR